MALGNGDKLAADAAAVDAMRHCLMGVEFTGRVVIGEGEKDAAPMLHNGEIVGTGAKPHADIAVDPLDGTSLVAGGGDHDPVNPEIVIIISSQSRHCRHINLTSLSVSSHLTVGHQRSQACILCIEHI